MKIDKQQLQNKTPKKRKKWLKGLGLFLLVYFLGGLVLQFFAFFAKLDDRYVGAISFVAGLIVLWQYISKEDDTEIDDATIK